MLPIDTIESMALMCEDHELSFVSGEFKAYRDRDISSNEHEHTAGIVKVIVNDKSNFIMWFMDSDHGVMTGACRTKVNSGTFMAGKEVSAEQKKQVIETFMSELW